MAKTNLTDAQRVILAAATARESGLVLPLPSSLGDNRGTVGVILKSLLTRSLITERPILPDEELWRDTAELGRTTLVISAAGLKLAKKRPKLIVALLGDSPGLGLRHPHHHRSLAAVGPKVIGHRR